MARKPKRAEVPGENEYSIVHPFFEPCTVIGSSIAGTPRKPIHYFIITDSKGQLYRVDPAAGAYEALTAK